jgi:hypothetical protein
MLPASLGAGPAPPAPGGAHTDLLRIVRELNRLVVTAQIPLSLAAQVFIQDPHLRKEVLRIMDMLNTMTGAPLVSQNVNAGLSNYRQAPPAARPQVMRQAAGDVGLEVLVQSIPALRALLTSR